MQGVWQRAQNQIDELVFDRVWNSISSDLFRETWLKHFFPNYHNSIRLVVMQEVIAMKMKKKRRKSNG